MFITALFVTGVLVSKAWDGTVFGAHPTLLAIGMLALPTMSVIRMRTRPMNAGDDATKQHMLLNVVGYVGKGLNVHVCLTWLDCALLCRVRPRACLRDVVVFSCVRRVVVLHFMHA